MRVDLMPRVVSQEETRLWLRRAATMWRGSWLRLFVLGLLAGLVVQLIPAPLRLVVTLVLGPSVVWMLAVTAEPSLGPSADDAPGPLPNWLPGAVRVLPLGVLVGSIAASVLLASSLVFAGVLVSAGVPLESVRGPVLPIADMPVAVAMVWNASGSAASMIVYGAASLLYVRGFGLFVRAVGGVSAASARLIGIRAWALNASAIRALWSGGRRTVALVVSTAAALLFVAFVTGVADPVVLALFTFVPCVFAVAFRSVFGVGTAGAEGAR